MYVTLKYRVVADEHNQWPLPVLLEQRNIFWNHHTQRSINGKSVAVKNAAAWLPGQVATAGQPDSSMLSFRDGNSVISAELLSDFPLSIADKRLAVLIDGSFSMRDQASSAVSALSALDQASMFFCQLRCEATDKLQSDQWLFYGKAQPLEQLAAFNADFDITEYDAVLLLSDGGTYEFNEDADSVTFARPVWLAQFGDGAHAYHDSLLDALRGSGGGIAGSVLQALIELSVLSGDGSASVLPLGVSGSRIWLQRPATGDEPHNPELSHIAAALRIEGVSRGQLNESVQSLDSLHDQAMKHGIVSRFSSMIVLVDERQRSRLAELSAKADRFQREVESAKHIVRQTGRAVPAVPEPHEWALLLAGMMMLLMVAYKRAKEQQWTMAVVAERIPFVALVLTLLGTGRAV